MDLSKQQQRSKLIKLKSTLRGKTSERMKPLNDFLELRVQKLPLRQNEQRQAFKAATPLCEDLIGCSKIPKYLHQNVKPIYKKYRSQHYSHSVLNSSSEESYSDYLIEKHRKKFQIAYLGISQIAKPPGKNKLNVSLDAKEDNSWHTTKSFTVHPSTTAKNSKRLRYGTSHGMYSIARSNNKAVRRSLIVPEKKEAVIIPLEKVRRRHVFLRKKGSLEDVGNLFEPNEESDKQRKISLDFPQPNVKFVTITLGGKADLTTKEEKVRRGKIVFGSQAREFRKTAKEIVSQPVELAIMEDKKPIVEKYKIRHEKKEQNNSIETLPVTIKIPSVNRLALDHNYRKNIAEEFVGEQEVIGERLLHRKHLH